jgi:hypothetical protein
LKEKFYLGKRSFIWRKDQTGGHVAMPEYPLA